MNNITITIILFIIGQIIVWIQSNGQFMWPWWKNNIIVVSVLLGGIVSYCFIKATYYSYLAFDGLLWPGRFIGFGTGTLVFGILTYVFMNEVITTKTIVSFILTIALIAVQLFWK